MGKPKVEFICPFAVHSGYAQAAHDTAMALYQAGVDLSITPLHDCNTEDLDPRYGCLLERVRAFDDPTHVIVMTIPRFAHEFINKDLDPGPGVKKICYTTWETDQLPESDGKNLAAHFDYIISPSGFTDTALARGGIPNNKLRVIPYGFEPKFWWIEEPPIPPDEPYTFYTINLWNERKAPIQLLKAYLSEFRGSKDKVKLRFVAQDVIDDDVMHLLRCSGLDDLPEVEFVKHDFPMKDRRLTELELRELHHTSHCYVTLSRGEAWALGAYEAAIVGNPVLATGFGGQWEFLSNYEQAHRIDYFLTPAITPEVKAGKQVNIGGFTFTPMKRAVPTGIAGDQNWAEPNIYDAKLLMRYAYTRRLKRTTADRVRMETLFSYRSVGARWKKFLEEC